MALQFIFGNSGSGKSVFLYRKIIDESLIHRDKNFLVIVPEQFTLQTQRDIVMMHPDKGIMNIDVLSFRRLAHRVFEELGTDKRTVLTESGKNFMLREVAGQQKDKLKVLGSRINRIGYISEIKSVLSELMQYEITDQDLQKMMNSVKERPLLEAKLEDIRVLYNAFLEYRKDHFMKPEELMEILAQVAGRSELLKNSVLAIDGFAGFTPSELHVLKELFKVCPVVYLTVTIDAREDFFGEINEYELFAPSRRMIRDAADAAGYSRSKKMHDTGNMPAPVILGPKNDYERYKKAALPRFSEKGALRHLEQNLFRKIPAVYSADPDEISMHCCTSCMQEVYFAARTIQELVRKKHYRYRDIAVITGDLSVYGNYVKRVFPMYGIPVFIDETRHLLLNPALEFVRGSLAMVMQDFSYETVFRFLRTGMAGFSPAETDLLENYVIAAGIRGRSGWEQGWTWYPKELKETVPADIKRKYMPDEESASDEKKESSSEGGAPEELELYNKMREKFMALAGPYSKEMQIKGRPLAEYADILYSLLEKCDVQQKLKDMENSFRPEEPDMAAEYSQVYRILIGLLDEMSELLGGESMDCREFSEILDAGLDEAKIGIIPPGIDQVQAGDIRRSRISDIKVLFFLGLNDGWVPQGGDQGGIVSDTEREILLQCGARLAPSARENSYIQRFYLYQNLTKPQEHLYLCWSLSNPDGSAMNPSYLVSTLLRLFPKLKISQEPDAGTDLSHVTSKDNGIQYFLYGIQNIMDSKDPGSSWLELYRQYLSDDAYSGRIRKLTAAAFSDQTYPALDTQTARQLYGMGNPDSTMTASVTRLEQFAGCAFSHFASYGLRLKERKEYGITAADLGTLFHESMEMFSKQMAADGCDFADLPYAEQAERMDRCVDAASIEYGGGILYRSAREEYTIRRLKRILRRTVQAMREQTGAGRFRPAGFEISFADTSDLKAAQVQLGGDGRIYLQGRIDRIDTAQTDDSVYVKVVDYKSGVTQFDPVSLYYGLQIQLVVYLNAAIELEQKLNPQKKIIPAGIFYCHMQDPVLPMEDSPRIAHEKLLKKMRPDGVVNRDGPIIRLFDENISGDSLVIPAGIKKDGTLKAASSIITTEQFTDLSGYVTDLLGRMGKAILDGDIEAIPFEYKKRSACDYCIFSDVCGFDMKIPDRCKKREPAMDAAKVWENIKRR